MSKIRVEENGSIHSCNKCVHQDYCDGETEDGLIRNIKKGNFSEFWKMGYKTIPIPSNCPIRHGTKQKEFVFR